MKQILKTTMAAAAAMALAASANAAAFNQGLTITDSNGHTVTLSSTSGAITQNGAVGDWTFLIATGTANPPFGANSATFPTLDIDISNAQYLGAGGAGSTLTVTFFGTGYGPTSGHAISQVTGGANTAGGTVTFSTYYSSLNAGATTTLISASGPIAPNGLGNYNYVGNGAITAPGLYSETAVFTLTGTTASGARAGAYLSLDGSLTTVPDGGTTLVLLGSALSSLALLRKRFAKA
ncbi:MAG TPA: VPDSG-CTERM sorting domain-containing protein [Verrucomicrobiae bacterium]|jgi:hypothetical protein|nr:VPDSG-CTERM sorting domain-containing protein [Verrucomicrobiae bacterium]